MPITHIDYAILSCEAGGCSPHIVDQRLAEQLVADFKRGVVAVHIPGKAGDGFGQVHLLDVQDLRVQLAGLELQPLLVGGEEDGLGVQLIGQAVSFYRPMGRTRLRLRCAPDNGVAQRFYQKYGFYKVGEAQGARVPLDILEKRIGYDDTE